MTPRRRTADYSTETAREIKKGRGEGAKARRAFIAARIREAISESERSIVDLADHLSISRSSIYDWQTAKSMPDVDKLAQLAMLTGVCTDWLITGQPPKHPAERYDLPRYEDDLPAPASFQPRWLREQIRAFYGGDVALLKVRLVPVNDDSMVPTFAVGDLALVDESGLRHGGPRKSGVYLFLDGKLRRVNWLPDGAMTISLDNTTYPRADGGQPVDERLIVGPAVLRISRL